MARLVAVYVLLVLLVSALAEINNAEKDMDYQKDTLLLLQKLLQQRIADPQNLLPPTRKRTCYFNAGLSHSCDYKDLVSAVDEANHWSSEFTPGRRKRFDGRHAPANRR